MSHYMYLKGITSHLTYKLNFILMNNITTVALFQSDFTSQKTFGSLETFLVVIAEWTATGI